ncbi:hypothetical protein B0I18_110115 [Taibaiella chishuiensis]|uniref:Uncharacterized protein n=1 Tax=Taibaiella chishuiensis TaxID=1434707 RepID=A0A2P8CXV3_9BACT|nr:hypothetical protein B0I18_110115 [Taibaiella chishuiensis]
MVSLLNIVMLMIESPAYRNKLLDRDGGYLFEVMTM